MPDDPTPTDEQRTPPVTLYVCPECGEWRCDQWFCFGPAGPKNPTHERADNVPAEYVPAQEARERERVLVEALRELVRLKDGPRDDAYRAQKDGAWRAGREALQALLDPAPDTQPPHDHE